MQSFDLVIVGTGSGNAIPESLSDRRIALVERDVFGGTCLNRGCIPSKMFIYAADQAMHVREASRYGLSAELTGVDWAGIVDRVFGRIDPIAAGGREYRIEGSPNVTVFEGSGRFIDHKVLDVDGETIAGDQFVLAAGARPFVPDIPGLVETGFHTSDSIMRDRVLPERLLIIGGGYIACELGHVFDAFGTAVTMFVRSDRLLRAEDDAVSERFTELSRERFDVRSGAAIDSVSRDGDEVVLRYHDETGGHEVRGDQLLVATGRVPNGDQLDVTATGVEVDHAGRVRVDDHLRTTVEGIWAFGDLSNRFQLKHVANAEARVVFHNVEHPDDLRTMDYGAVPHAVFSNPQVASVGMTERDAASEGVPFVTATQDYGGTAYGWAMEDTTSFAKVIAHASTRQILGAHIIGPQAATLIQPLIQAMQFDRTVEEVARGQMWIHPALTEVVENALLALD